MSRPDIDAELGDAFQDSSIAPLRQLEALGVSRTVCAELGLNRWGVIRASEGEDGLYILGEGEPHLVLPVIDQGELVDLVAFRSSDPNRWLLRRGVGWALGLESGLERHTWGDPVPLAVSPLEWLQQGADGLCVLDWDAPEVHYLVGVPHLVCSNEHQAAMLRRALSRPVRFPAISVMEARCAA